jgi:hypothetical protein
MEVSGQLHATAALPSGERAPETHWVSPRAGLDDVEKRKIFPLPEVRLRKGKALGSEKGKGLGCGLFYEQRRS